MEVVYWHCTLADYKVADDFPLQSTHKMHYIDPEFFNLKTGMLHVNKGQTTII